MMRDEIEEVIVLVLVSFVVTNWISQKI